MAGHIVGIIGAKGGVGKSVVAANYAAAFSQEMKQKPLLIDADFNSLGDQNLIVGQNPPKNLADLTSSLAGPLNPKELAPYLKETSSGLLFLGAPRDSHMAKSFNLESFGRLLKGITGLFPLTVIDCGHQLDELTLRVLDHASLICVITTPDIMCLSQTKRLLHGISESLYPQDLVQVIFNRIAPTNLVNASMAAKSLNKEIFFSLADEPSSFEQALAKASPVCVSMPQSTASRSFRDLVRRVQQLGLLEKATTLKRAPRPAQKKATTSIDGTAPSPTTGNAGGPKVDRWTLIKLRIHRELIDRMDLKSSGGTDNNDPNHKNALRARSQKAILEILETLDSDTLLQTREQKSQMIKEVLDEALGLGPLEDLLADENVTEIMVNARDQIYIEKNGKPAQSSVTFSSESQMMNVIERIVTPLGRRVDEKVPYVDARLSDGSRVHVIIPPLALKGPTITIRKFPKKRIEYKDLINYGSMTEEIADFLRICVEGKLNIVVSGGTGSGKTTLLNVLSNFIPSTERIITVEDSAELQLGQEHVVRLESRPKNIEGEGEVSIRELIKCCLRMRPDRIVVGECRGGEALDMLQAMNTGHSGSLTTLHANNPRECIARLETLVMMSGLNLPVKAIRENIASAVGVIIQQSRLSDGSRKITHITEMIGMQGDVVSLQDIFIYKQEGLDKKRKVIGKFQPTGFVPSFVEEMEAKGLKISRSLFNPKPGAA